jgi:glycolate dehydrogenase FAD-binding subunit
VAHTLRPSTFDEAAAALAASAAGRQAVRIVGGSTKLDWVTPPREPDVELALGGLDQIVEHNAGDLTTTLQAGVTLAAAQAQFATAGQMLALDPPLGRDSAATIGGIVATGDSGPLRHRYGTPRDLVLGMTVALSDGTIARSGGKVIKNVAGYDIAKLFAGSFGTLGAILSVNLRLHPLPAATATALGASTKPEVLAGAARALARAPLELDALDVAWHAGRGGVLVRCAGSEAVRRASRAAELMRTLGLEDVDCETEDRALWARQRAGQRSQRDALIRVAARPSALAGVLRAAEGCDATLVGRAGLGCSYAELDVGAVAHFRGQLPPGAVAVLLDAPGELRAGLDPWGVTEGPALELMRRVKARFDPAGTCNPGVFVGGI